MKKSLLFVLAALLAPELAAQQLPTVVAAPAQVIEFTPNTMEIGEVKAEESVDLVARVSGFLTAIHFREGEKVKAGTVLFEIDDREYAAKVKKEESTRTQKLAEKKRSDAEYKRQKSLFEKNIDSEQKFERIEAEKFQADAALLAAEAELDLAKLDLEYTKIKAPFDGWIGFRSNSAGDLVGPNSGKLASVEKSGKVKVDFNIADTDLVRLMRYMENAKVKIAQVPVELYAQDGKKIPLTGELKAWDNQLNRNTATLKLQALFDDPDRKLMPGVYVKVKLMLGMPEQDIAIPLAAVTYDVAGTYIFVLKDAKDGKAVAEQRYIEVMAKDGGMAYLSKGLEKGEMVIVAGMQKVRSGSACAYTVQGGATVPAASAETPKKTDGKK